MTPYNKYFYFYIAILLWMIHSILLAAKIHVSFFDNYLDDLTLLPIILGIALIIQRKKISKNNEYKFNRVLILFAWLYFCIMFELVIPHLSKSFTADWLDCIAYGLGAYYFDKLINK
jgi:hypothetical protein